MRRTSKLATIIAATAIAGAATGVQASDMGGYNVVLIHGFQPDNLLFGAQSDSEQEAESRDYWADYWGPRASAEISWDATERIEGGIAERAYDQVRDIAQSGICADGCLYVVHSTGSNVAGMLLENQDRWLEAEGINPFDVIASVDLAGADGGTNLANIGVSIAESDSWLLKPAKDAVKLFTGFAPDSAENFGVVNDLQTSVARNSATAPNDVPRLRVAGSDNEFFGATDPFLDGANDGVVSLASACGSVSTEGVDSCLSNRKSDGTVASTNAPDSLYHNHIPLLMSDEAGHLNMLGTDTGHVATVGEGFEALSFVQAGDQAEFQEGAWWNVWSKDRIRIPESGKTHLSETTFKAFSN